MLLNKTPMACARAIIAAQALVADLGKSAMAIADGEAWLNMVQAFWALPAHAIPGLGLRDIIG